MDTGEMRHRVTGYCDSGTYAFRIQVPTSIRSFIHTGISADRGRRDVTDWCFGVRPGVQDTFLSRRSFPKTYGVMQYRTRRINSRWKLLLQMIIQCVNWRSPERRNTCPESGTVVTKRFIRTCMSWQLDSKAVHNDE